jgi:hypothetical protein
MMGETHGFMHESAADRRVDLMVEWTREKIATLSSSHVESLRENAAKRGRQDIVELCNEELAHRKPLRAKRASEGANEDRGGHYVSEFHFVCPNELGITRNQDGTIWTGTWVVAEKHAENAVRYGALAALHSSKAEPSYLQGTVKAWRKSPRQARYSGEQLAQTSEGIQLSNIPLPWKGTATGEKGYAWKPIAD